ncbi:MAG: DUF1961 family protein [Rhodothermales bacterium]
MKRLLHCLILTCIVSGCNPAVSDEWRLIFTDSGTSDWTKKWFLEGAKAAVENGSAGMVFNAGPVPGEHASHAVLWTQDSFAGDLKIEYDYTRLDTMTHVTSVNILYIQATGLGTDTSPADIRLSTEQREEPWMSSYYLNMNALHISYSTTGPERAYYVSSRRYPAKDLDDFGDGTQIQPIYENVDLFKPGETYHITVVKQDNRLSFTAERAGETHVFDWDTSAFPLVMEGRIGFRHMWARSSRYSNIEVYTRD